MKIAIVGSGLYGASLATLCYDHDVTVFEKRDHLGGNIYSTYDEDHGHVSEYGAHIFHTDSKRIWDFINQYSPFNNYQHYVIGRLPNDHLVDLPFNLTLFNQILGIRTPGELNSYLRSLPTLPGDDLESHCISQVGRSVYEAVVKNYTEKQWGRPCSSLPKSIIHRLPIRLTHDRTYFRNAKYQGMPVDGYTKIIQRMLSKAKIEYHDVDLASLTTLCSTHDHVFFSGQVDRLFSYSLGCLPYRGLHFKRTEVLQSVVQGAPVINDLTTNSRTRTIEHSLFYPERPHHGPSIVTEEFPIEWEPGMEPYYPVRNHSSEALHDKYLELAKSSFPNLTIGGRLGAFQYYDMDQVIGMAIKDFITLTRK